MKKLVLGYNGVLKVIEEFFESSEEEMKITSPYLKISKDFRKLLEKKYNEDVDIGIAYRTEDGGELDQLKIMPNIRIFKTTYDAHCQTGKNSHSIYYINEKIAITTSMPLLPYSGEPYFSYSVSIDDDSGEYSKICNIIKTMFDNKRQTSGPKKVDIHTKEKTEGIFSCLILWIGTQMRDVPEISRVINQYNMVATDATIKGAYFREGGKEIPFMVNWETLSFGNLSVGEREKKLLDLIVDNKIVLVVFDRKSGDHFIVIPENPYFKDYKGKSGGRWLYIDVRYIKLCDSNNLSKCVQDIENNENRLLYFYFDN
jgi:hypothetical protein